MSNRAFSLSVLLAITAFTTASLPAQQPDATAKWRVMLEKAVFARAYEGNPEATKQLFEQALAAAKASGEQGAEAAVRKQQASADNKQDPRSEVVIGRLLHSIAATGLPERLNKINSIDWEFYQRDPSTARSIARCLAGKVWIGDINVDLRVEDLMRIADQLDTRHNIPILQRALGHKNPFVRTMALERCRQDEHLPLIIKALTDENQLVREGACDRMPNIEDLSAANRKALRAALLKALDLGTFGAIEQTIDLPGFLARMQAASHDSVLAQAIIDQQAEPYVTAWDAEMIGMTKRLLDWADACNDTQRKALFASCAYRWLMAEQQMEGYPKDLARRCINLALANAAGFHTGHDHLESLGGLVAYLGTIDDLFELGPKWLADERFRDDCIGLFSLARRLGKEHTQQLINHGVKLAELVTEAEHTDDCFRAYWNRLGRHNWHAAGTEALAKGVAASKSVPGNLSRVAYSSFVTGVRSSPRSNDLIKAMEAHYADVAKRRLLSESHRTLIAKDLASIGSQYAAEAALALRGRWVASQLGEQYGDFLRRACALAGDAGKDAVLRAMRKGYTARPRIMAGQHLAQTSWPIQVGGGRGGRNGWIPSPPPTDKVVFQKQNKTVLLPSLLCVLPPDQAAQAARELWQEDKPPVSRDELVRVLLYARSSKHALDALVQGFDQIVSGPDKAEVLLVFGELLHPAGRKIIALSLDSPEPLIRHAALEAAQNVLAHARAKEGMRVYRDM